MKRPRGRIDHCTAAQDLIVASAALLCSYLLRNSRPLHLPLTGNLGPPIGFDKLLCLWKGPLQFRQERWIHRPRPQLAFEEIHQAIQTAAG